MKAKRLKRSLSFFLAVVMLIGMIPAAALAATPGGALSIVERKNMRLTTFDDEEISVYYFGSPNEQMNFYTSETNMGNIWTRLSYTIEKSQEVSLELWRLDIKIVRRKPHLSLVDLGGDSQTHYSFRWF